MTFTTNTASAPAKGYTLQKADSFLFTSQVPTDLCGEAVFYAVSRYLRRSGTLIRELANESCRLRRADRARDRRPRYHTFVYRSAQLDLPGGWTRFTLAVSPDAITVTRVGIFRSRPKFRSGNAASASGAAPDRQAA